MNPFASLADAEKYGLFPAGGDESSEMTTILIDGKSAPRERG